MQDIRGANYNFGYEFWSFIQRKFGRDKMFEMYKNYANPYIYNSMFSPEHAVYFEDIGLNRDEVLSEFYHELDVRNKIKVSDLDKIRSEVPKGLVRINQ